MSEWLDPVRFVDQFRKMSVLETYLPIKVLSVTTVSGGKARLTSADALKMLGNSEINSRNVSRIDIFNLAGSSCDRENGSVLCKKKKQRAVPNRPFIQPSGHMNQKIRHGYVSATGTD
jgi:hypothetical protein